jgi:N-acetylglucosamine-6-sulfatase
MVNDPHETKNIYNNPKHAKLVDSLKQWFAKLRKKVGDDGSHYPDCEKVVQEFWDYSETDQKKAVVISNEYLKRRKSELAEGLHNPKTSGKP